MRWEVYGADEKTGGDVVIVVDAASRTMAEMVAKSRGVMVESVRSQPVPMGGRKFFLVSTAAVTSGIAAYAASRDIFENISSRITTGISLDKSKHDTVPIYFPTTSNSVGRIEGEFIDSVERDDVEACREKLLENINWNQVATASLRAIIEKKYLAGYEREFWLSLARRLVQDGASVSACVSVASDSESFKFLISNGADINQKNEYGETPLIHFSNGLLKSDLTAFLIENGANVNAVDNVGNSAMHVAARSNGLIAIGNLIYAKADVNKVNSKGLTPLSVAIITIQREAEFIIRRNGGIEKMDNGIVH